MRRTNIIDRAKSLVRKPKKHETEPDYWNDQTFRPSKHVVIVRVIDFSGSKSTNNAADLRYTLGVGNKKFKETLIKKGYSHSIDYQIIVIGFNNQPWIIQNLTPVADYPDELPFSEPNGYTNIQSAMEFAYELVEETKSDMKARSMKPAVVVVLDTDGIQCNEHGWYGLTPDFVKRTKELNDEHHLTTICALMGDNSKRARQLVSQVAPSTTFSLEDGTKVKNPHAFIMQRTDGSQPDELARLLSKLVEKATSSSTYLGSEAPGARFSTEALFVTNETDVPPCWTSEYFVTPANVTPVFSQ